jgi:glutamine synthetase
MKKIAKHHGLVCLLHEKPFRGVNGSGKHNNWSIGTDDGINLMNPGKTPQENLAFLVFVSAVLEAVDTYSPLLRLSAANTGNDHRLGANEAPPAIVSVFLGAELESIFRSVADGTVLKSSSGQKLELGVDSLPKLPKDLTDRNRTSPFAFTGNKFEFRMVPSSDSIAGPNFVINTIVAEVLSSLVERLEKSTDMKATVKQIVADTWKKHSKIVFNGNGYTEEWVAEAKKRGLPNLTSSVEAWPYLVKEDSVRIFTKHKVLSEEELHARLDIVLEKYSKQINIEAGVAFEMATREILPVCADYAVELAAQCQTLEGSGVKAASLKKKMTEIMDLVEKASLAAEKLEADRQKAKEVGEVLDQAKFYRDSVVVSMETLRSPVDKLEKLLPKEYWPMPTYEELLFKI